MKIAGAFSQNHLNLGIKTYLNSTLTSNIIDTSQVAADTTHRPKTALPHWSSLRRPRPGGWQAICRCYIERGDGSRAPSGKAQQALSFLLRSMAGSPKASTRSI